MKGEKKTLLLIVLVTVTAGILLGFGIQKLRAKSPERLYQKQMELGNKYLLEENYEEAVVAFTKAIETDPKAVEAYIGLAEAYVAMEDLELAVLALEEGYEQTGEERLRQMQEGDARLYFAKMVSERGYAGEFMEGTLITNTDSNDRTLHYETEKEEWLGIIFKNIADIDGNGFDDLLTVEIEEEEEKLYLSESLYFFDSEGIKNRKLYSAEISVIDDVVKYFFYTHGDYFVQIEETDSGTKNIGWESGQDGVHHNEMEIEKFDASRNSLGRVLHVNKDFRESGSVCYLISIPEGYYAIYSKGITLASSETERLQPTEEKGCAYINSLVSACLSENVKELQPVSWDNRWDTSFIPDKSGLSNYAELTIEISPEEMLSGTKIRNRMTIKGEYSLHQERKRPYAEEEEILSDSSDRELEMQEMGGDFSEPEIEISDYLEDIFPLTTLLDMSKRGDGSNSYECDGFELSSWSYDESRSNYTITNSGHPDVVLYGVGIQGSVEELREILREKNWVEFDRFENKYRFCALINSQAYGIYVTADEEGRVQSWFINNWFDIDIPVELKEMYYGSLEPWKGLYLRFVEENYLEEFPGLKITLPDIDGDGIPEMIIETGFVYGGSIACTVRDGEVNFIYADDYGISYMERSGLLADSGGRQGVYHDKVYELRDGAFTLIGDGTRMSRDGYDFENLIMSWNGMEMSKEEYNQNLNALFDTTKAISAQEGAVTYWELIRTIGGEEHPYPGGM